jgi:hypothetical protein
LQFQIIGCALKLFELSLKCVGLRLVFAVEFLGEVKFEGGYLSLVVDLVGLLLVVELIL